MSTSLANSSEGSRPSSRRPKNDATVSDHNKTPKSGSSSPKRSRQADFPSPPATRNGVDTTTQSPAPKKKSPRSKKPNNGSQPGRNTAQTQHTSQSDTMSERKATPLKQAYAGPTFHSSPAASSLPMPSFYSKSLPTVTASPALAPPNQLDGQGQAESDTEPLKPAHSEEMASKGREPSPLDFMFEAARKARESPRAQSPDYRLDHLSPFDDIPRRMARTPGENSSESVFPFELDGNGGKAMPIGPAFATPYKDRMEALRSPQGQSMTSPSNLDEKERKEKSEALKRLLASTSPHRYHNKPEANGYFSDGMAGIQSNDLNPPRTRHRSGSSTPQSGIRHAPVPQYHFQDIPITSKGRDPPVQRPVSSHLRREFQPDDYQAPAELESDSAPPSRTMATRQNNRRSLPAQKVNQYLGQPPQSAINPAMQTRPAHSAQKLEDDLRRFLKLDLTSSG